MKKEMYESPAITIVNVDMETALLLNFNSAGTSDPKEGGDPTGGGDHQNPDPFAPAKINSLWENNPGDSSKL